MLEGLVMPENKLRQNEEAEKTYLPPGRPWHGEAEEITGTANNGSCFARGHRNVKRTYQYLPIFLPNEW
jgi:hypothetical protein